MAASTKHSRKQSRVAHLRVRVSEEERHIFEAASELLGLDLSTWTRTELRRAAIKELKQAGTLAQYIE